MFHPSQKEFEKFVPSLRDGGEEIYKGIKPYLQPAYWRLKNELKVELMNNKCAPYFRRAVYATAAYNALPTLDLVATPNGFGVVSNQNIAPASKERVAGFRESLRQYKSDSKDQCLERYYKQAKDGYTDQVDEFGGPIKISPDTILRSGVIYSPTVARENGITMPDGRPVYEEEMHIMRYTIAAADTRIRKLIGGKQFDYEMGAGRFGEKLDLMLRRLAAMYVMNADRRTVKDCENEILDFMEEEINRAPNSERYAFYKTSVQRDLRLNVIRYENRKEDPTYFF